MLQAGFGGNVLRSPRQLAPTRCVPWAANSPLDAQNAGHASLDTTTRYVTTEAARRMEAMQAVWDAGRGD
ncbi:hypothetical protein P3W85_32270 [Cupriavidus basilensis]|uniref:Integrase n=1 Tax=Cupriavidus basilensis TaxID=68895 RepID=A0ABT6AYB4_9BURK|nr:hypothetical protein [Cupriavidus basilensis]MDF3837588.1 hypothetical protein [Cupriavidus basilensis]